MREMAEKTIINVSGMSCGHCVKTVENSVEQLAGVSGVKVNLELNNVEVNFDGNVVNLKQITNVIENQGYVVL